MVCPKQSVSKSPYTHPRTNMKRLSNRLSSEYHSDITSRPALSASQQQKLRSTRRAPVSSRNQVAQAYASLYLPGSTSRQNELFKKLLTIPGGLQLSSHVINKTATRIQAHWEGDQSAGTHTNSESTSQSVRTVQLSTYISTILTRTSLSPVTNSTSLSVFSSFSCVALVLSLIYVDRLKKMHPAAKGEAGCGLRLFLVSYMVATKYIQAHINSLTNSTAPSSTTPPTKLSRDEESNSSQSVAPIVPLSSLISPNEHWARLSSIFSTPELTRMELEFLSFLQFDLYVSYEDFKYYWSMYMEINQTVPEENPSSVIDHSFGGEENLSDDASVPDM